MDQTQIMMENPNQSEQRNEHAMADKIIYSQTGFLNVKLNFREFHKDNFERIEANIFSINYVNY